MQGSRWQRDGAHKARARSSRRCCDRGRVHSRAQARQPSHQTARLQGQDHNQAAAHVGSARSHLFGSGARPDSFGQEEPTVQNPYSGMLYNLRQNRGFIDEPVARSSPARFHLVFKSKASTSTGGCVEWMTITPRGCLSTAATCCSRPQLESKPGTMLRCTADLRRCVAAAEGTSSAK